MEDVSDLIKKISTGYPVDIYDKVGLSSDFLVNEAQSPIHDV